VASAHTEVVTITEIDQPDVAREFDLDAEGFTALDFADVPAADSAAVVDPHWLELRGDSLLPTLYMPPAMPGQRSALMRLVSSGLIAIFMLATTLGICLTYGPPPT
jgi:hypothetical protein